MTAKEVLSRFVPKHAVNYCDDLYQQANFEFKIKKTRQTKMGDYCYNPKTDRHTITINNDLNPYSFLITYLHEVAHLIAFKKYGRLISPHGKEWKHHFKEIASPILSDKIFPKAILFALKNYFKKPKASSCSDPVLYQLLKKFDTRKGTIFLKEISIGKSFIFNKRKFVKLETKRTRSVCEAVLTRRKYLIPDVAEVLSN